MAQQHLDAGSSEAYGFEDLGAQSGPDVDVAWAHALLLVVSVSMIVIGYMTTTRSSVADWQVRNTGQGRLWAWVLGEESARSAAQTFFGPNAIAVGIVGLVLLLLDVVLRP